ncbi:hypothetical protein [Actinomadura chokoriensis]|uniref:hypothetical protein n=1 Tax=Actinomadura chokoriensis TaxID=454156 RepID=UPI0031F7FDB4
MTLHLSSTFRSCCSISSKASGAKSRSGDTSNIAAKVMICVASGARPPGPGKASNRDNIGWSMKALGDIAQKRPTNSG